MAKRPIPTTANMQAAIKKIDPNIPCEVIDPRDLVVAGGVSMGLWVYNGTTGGYELTVRDKANNKWKSFDVGDNANCIEDAAKCFVDFYNAKHKSESHNKFNCSMQKKKESLSKKQEADEGEGLEDQPEDVQKMVKELAEYTDNDVADANIEDYAPGNGICVTFGDEEYYCYADKDDAEAAAKDDVKDFLEMEGIAGIRFENIGGIEQFLDVDWFKDAQREDAEFYVSDIKESEPERYKEEFGDIDEEDAVEKCLADWGDDYIQWFKDNFGTQEFETAIKENGLVDFDALAEAIVDYDGPAMSLASYDNNEILLDCDYYCYRHN